MPAGTIGIQSYDFAKLTLRFGKLLQIEQYPAKRSVQLGIRRLDSDGLTQWFGCFGEFLLVLKGPAQSAECGDEMGLDSDCLPECGLRASELSLIQQRPTQRL